MGVLKKEVAAKPVLVARPVKQQVSATEHYTRTMKRFPATMARLAE